MWFKDVKKDVEKVHDILYRYSIWLPDEIDVNGVINGETTGRRLMPMEIVRSAI